MGEIVGRIELTIGWPICHDMPIHIDTWEYNPTQKWWAPQSTVGAPVGLDNFFPVGAVPKLKMPSQETIIPPWMLQGWGSGKQMLEPGK